jgi:hypothetical protein
MTASAVRRWSYCAASQLRPSTKKEPHAACHCGTPVSRCQMLAHTMVLLISAACRSLTVGIGRARELW